MFASPPSRPPRETKVLVAMSGGVDSSVSACLLKEQGYDVMGLFMRVGAEQPEETTCTPASAGDADAAGEAARTHQGCCSAADAADARFVAGMLDIPFYALNFQADFARIIDYFADEYARGRTPNPCVQCNTWLKFGKLIDYADAIGADYVATGHYAQLGHGESGIELRRGRDVRKDQSYFLFGVQRDMLARAMFPVGGLAKDAVREHARRFGLPVTDKPDSVEICFVPDRDYARVVRRERPDAFVAGDIVDDSGKVLGRHDGVANFTIGQRRGLGVAAGRPMYVTSLDVLNHTVTLGEREALLARRLIARDANFFGTPPTDAFRCAAQIRYQHRAAACTARLAADGMLTVAFDEPQSAVTPGQAVVLYDGDRLLGGGWIDHAE
ncbi:MAG TPA: tRNA 2-thiouridine(34) synthase MnmA [Phycisphaerae bacterium]|nr:tRNA 2-thiouridine(34) synthase MnmA [Phycisphaerae bacterium]